MSQRIKSKKCQISNGLVTVSEYYKCMLVIHQFTDVSDVYILADCFYSGMCTEQLWVLIKSLYLEL